MQQMLTALGKICVFSVYILITLLLLAVYASTELNHDILHKEGNIGEAIVAINILNLFSAIVYICVLLINTYTKIRACMRTLLIILQIFAVLLSVITFSINCAFATPVCITFVSPLYMMVLIYLSAIVLGIFNLCFKRFCQNHKIHTVEEESTAEISPA